MEPSSPHRMEPLGLQGLRVHQIILMMSPTQTVPSWQWVDQEPSSPLRMEPHGLQGLLVHQILSEKSLTETAYMLRLVFLEPFSHLLMEPHGLQELPEHQTNSEESPLDEAHSPSPLGKLSRCCLARLKKIFRIGKPESVGTP